MKMVGHQHVSDEFAWPFQVEGVQFVQKGGAESRVCEDFSSIQNVASNEMQRARKIEVGPFSSHEKAGASPPYLTLRLSRRCHNGPMILFEAPEYANSAALR